MSRPAPCTRLCISSGAWSLQRRGERVGDAGRDGLGELLPDGQRRLDPPAAGQRARWCRELRDRRRLAQPQRRERERLVEVGALAGGDAQAVLVRDVQRLALGEIPRDAAVAAAGECALQLLHHASASSRGRCPARQPRELLRVEIALRHRRAAAGAAPGTRSSGLWSSPSDLPLQPPFSRVMTSRSTLVARIIALPGTDPSPLRRSRTTRQKKVPRGAVRRERHHHARAPAAACRAATVAGIWALAVALAGAAGPHLPADLVRDRAARARSTTRSARLTAADGDAGAR